MRILIELKWKLKQNSCDAELLKLSKQALGRKLTNKSIKFLRMQNNINALILASMH